MHPASYPRAVLLEKQEPAATASAAAPLLRRVLDSPFVQAASYAGAALYFVLTLIYDRYLGKVGLNTGDVGLDRVTMLGRAAAGIVILLGLSAVISAFRVLYGSLFWLLALAYQKLIARMRRLARDDPKHASALEAYAQVHSLLRKVAKWLGWTPIGSALVVLTVQPDLLFPFTRKAMMRTFVTIASMTLVLGTVWATVTVSDRADDAVQGKPVKPLSVLGLNIIDINAIPVQIRWTGSGTAPSELLRPDLKYLGRNNSTLQFRTGGTTISAPAANIIVLFPDS
ncbi:hypothetical protein [Actinoplanes sp. NPDC049681]|uniref:hypothetical protein n=1 Tax=Actinoplanes sp. NPDC049681 TaxID=3363905 RepID=UPI0037B8DFBA